MAAKIAVALIIQASILLHNHEIFLISLPPYFPSSFTSPLIGYNPNVRSLRNETALGLLLSMRGWRQGLDVPATTLLLLQHGADATVLDGRGRNLLDLTLRFDCL